jgi:hypothetical protein
MPIRLDSLPIPDPHAVKPTQDVTISLPMHSTGNANTMATIRYSIDPSNNICFPGGAKVVTTGPFVVPVPPGVVNDDVMTLTKCPAGGTSVVLLPIGLDVQECDAAGLPIGIPDHRNVMVQIL